MIGTIRKHSSWLWFIIITATIVSFVVFFSPSQRMGGGGGNDDFGKIYGKKITKDAYLAARREFFIFYWFHYGGEWPGTNTRLTETDLDREIYVRMMLIQKAGDLGIYVGDDAAAGAAGQKPPSPRRNGPTGAGGEICRTR